MEGGRASIGKWQYQLVASTLRCLYGSHPMATIIIWGLRVSEKYSQLAGDTEHQEGVYVESEQVGRWVRVLWVVRSSWEFGTRAHNTTTNATQVLSVCGRVSGWMSELLVIGFVGGVPVGVQRWYYLGHTTCVFVAKVAVAGNGACVCGVL